MSCWMSALGQKQTFECIRAMSALPPKADIAERCRLSALCQKRTLLDRIGGENSIGICLACPSFQAARRTVGARESREDKTG